MLEVSDTRFNTGGFLKPILLWEKENKSCNRSSISDRMIRAIQGWNNLKEGNEIDVFAAQDIYYYMSGNGNIEHGHKEAIKTASEEVKYNYSSFRLKAQNSVAAMALPINNQSALEVSEDRRQHVFEDRWNKGGVPFIAAFEDLNFNREANETAAKYVRNKIKSLVKDSNVAKLLSPTYPIGCKRLAVDSNYYETYNRSNISLIDLKTDPLKEFSKDGISTSKKSFELDVVILATGFDAMTGTLFNIDIEGKDNIKLKDKWSNGPKNYLGLASSGFPNLFTVSGPGSPSVLTNMIVSIEQHVNWIFDCIKYMQNNDKSFIEASLNAEDDWFKHNQEVSIDHVRSSCSSWYIGANIKGKAKNFMPYVGGYSKYVEKCNEVSKNDYEGFILK